MANMTYTLFSRLSLHIWADMRFTSISTLEYVRVCAHIENLFPILVKSTVRSVPRFNSESLPVKRMKCKYTRSISR